MTNACHGIPASLACLIGMTLASAAVAQAPRSSLDVTASAGAPEFRDPKTGQVWTPETVGQDGRPLTGPDDKAFDPQAQNAPVKIAEQRLRGRPVGTVPVTAGPTVPIVALTNSSLRAVPGQRWQAVLYLDTTAPTPSTRSLSADSPTPATPSWKRAPSSTGQLPACARASRSMARAPVSSSTVCRVA
jgi:hypothetical protein